MRRELPALLAGIVLLTFACSPPKPSVAPSAHLEATNRLATADDLLRLGCFDCLVDALREYDAIRGQANLPAATVEVATIGFIRVALLLGIRERELGTTDEGYFGIARQAAEAREDLRQLFVPLIDAAEAIPSPIFRFDSIPDPAVRRREMAFREGLSEFLSVRRTRADDEPLAAYSWVTFMCTFGGYDERSPEMLLAPLQQMRDIPLVTYRVATCPGADPHQMEYLLEREPQFIELNYWLAQQAVSQRRLDEAEKLFVRAYMWRHRWPAVTTGLANLYFAFEEPDRALDFYDQTLSLLPGYPDAMLGRVKALSVLGRHNEAFQTIDLMIGGLVRVLPGEAYYWRAWNDLQVDRLDAASTDIEEANRLWINSEVSKLAGIIAYRRHELDQALQRFEAARKLNPEDCETSYYLGLVHADQRRWISVADVFTSAASCFETARQRLLSEIEDIRRSTSTGDRQTRQIIRREQEIAVAIRMLATSWFNTAAAYFNLAHLDEARAFAEKVANDERFGERARELLKRLNSR